MPENLELLMLNFNQLETKLTPKLLKLNFSNNEHSNLILSHPSFK